MVDESRMEARVRNARALRESMETEIEFIGDFDLLVARGINISEGGICFETQEAFPFEMKFEWKGKTCRRRGRLVWVERTERGGYRLGFEFVPSEAYPVI